MNDAQEEIVAFAEKLVADYGRPGDWLDQLVNVARDLDARINTPEIVDFAKAVRLEAIHQRERWPAPPNRARKPTPRVTT